MEKPPRKLVLITLAVMIAGTVFGYCLIGTQKLKPLRIEIPAQPTFGNLYSKVKLVIFEEPLCDDCKLFNDEVFPSIKKEFIDTGKISCTIIPVSFIPGSMPFAEAILCAYHQNQDAESFCSALNEIYEAAPKEQTAFKECIDKGVYRAQILYNTEYGKKIMGGTLMTPTAYLNGVEIKDMGLEEMKTAIESNSSMQEGS